MSKRRNIPKAVLDSVLVTSRRRCCICFGLNRDTSLKSGQVAHLDQDRENNSEDNLAFLCLPHHDEYDSKTSQRKNFTMTEVKSYRVELHEALREAFNKRVAFGEAGDREKDFCNFEGHYIRTGGDNDSAELQVSRLLDGRYHISGWAFWNTKSEFGPNMGNLDFVGKMFGSQIQYVCTVGVPDHESEYNAVLTFSDDQITLVEIGEVMGIFGLNVTFRGTYARAD